jgi:hypothetical protein
MAGEALENKRNFGTELREASGNMQWQRQILRETVMEAANINEVAARRVFDAFIDAELVFVTEEGYREGENAILSLHRLKSITDDLLPDSDTTPLQT